MLGLDTKVAHEGRNTETQNINNNPEGEDGANVLLGGNGFGGLLENSVYLFRSDISIIKIKTNKTHTTSRIGIIDLGQNMMF